MMPNAHRRRLAVAAQLAPTLQRKQRAAAQLLKGQVLLVKVNSDENPQLSQRFGIRSIPTLLQMQQGKELQRMSGALPAPQIVGWLRR